MLFYDRALGKECVTLLTRTDLRYGLGLGVEGAGGGSGHNVQLLTSIQLSGQKVKKKKKKKLEIRVTAIQQVCPACWGQCVVLITVRTLLFLTALSASASRPAPWCGPMAGVWAWARDLLQGPPPRT